MYFVSFSPARWGNAHGQGSCLVYLCVFPASNTASGWRLVNVFLTTTLGTSGHAIISSPLVE